MSSALTTRDAQGTDNRGRRPKAVRIGCNRLIKFGSELFNSRHGLYDLSSASWHSAAPLASDCGNITRFTGPSVARCRGHRPRVLRKNSSPVTGCLSHMLCAIKSRSSFTSCTNLRSHTESVSILISLTAKRSGAISRRSAARGVFSTIRTSALFNCSSSPLNAVSLCSSLRMSQPRGQQVRPTRQADHGRFLPQRPLRFAALGELQ